MRVLLSTTSGAGHFRPLLPLVRVLQTAGHELACAAPVESRAMVERAGLLHLPFDGVPPGEPDRTDAFARAPGLPPEQGRHLVGSVVFGRLNTTYALPGARSAVQDFAPDLVLHESAEVATRIAAELAGVPAVQVLPVLGEPTLPRAVSAGVADLRASLGLDPDADGSASLRSPAISWFPPSFDVPEAPRQVRRYRDVDLPESTPLEQRDLVYVTLGSEAAGLPFFAPVLQQVVAGALRAGLPVVVATGRAVDPDLLAGIDGPLRVETWIDQRALLRKARAVVCHAGAGTTLDALTAQVPVVAVPLFADQPDNAERIAATGCGRVVRPAASAVAAAVEELVTGDVPAGCVRIGTELAGLPAVHEAVPWLESLAR